MVVLQQFLKKKIKKKILKVKAIYTFLKAFLHHSFGLLHIHQTNILAMFAQLCKSEFKSLHISPKPPQFCT